jgi:uncharacterized DUF497 family protein
VARHHPRYAEAWDWDENNEAELARHRISVREVYEVWADGPEWVRNKLGGSGDHKMIGLTDGGRALSIVVKDYPDRRLNRAITGWDATEGERKRYL